MLPKEEEEEERGGHVLKSHIEKKKGYLMSKYDTMHTVVRFNFYSLIIFTNPSAQAGYDTMSIFKRSLTGLNSEFSFS